MNNLQGRFGQEREQRLLIEAEGRRQFYAGLVLISLMFIVGWNL